MSQVSRPHLSFHPTSHSKKIMSTKRGGPVGVIDYWEKSCRDQLRLTEITTANGSSVIFKDAKVGQLQKLPSNDHSYIDGSKISSSTCHDEEVSQTRPESSGAKHVTDWVQCDDCDKWHALPSWVSARDLPDHWSCQMNVWNVNEAVCNARSAQSPADSNDLGAVASFTTDGATGISFEPVSIETMITSNESLEKRLDLDDNTLNELIDAIHQIE